MKTKRIKFDINNLISAISDVVSNSRSKIARENGFGIAIGIDLLIAYLEDIASRAIELNDDVLIGILVDMSVLKIDDEGGSENNEAN